MEGSKALKRRKDVGTGGARKTTGGWLDAGLWSESNSLRFKSCPFPRSFMTSDPVSVSLFAFLERGR